MGRGDPKVTGVLPIGLEEATKLMTYVTKSGKEYVCVMQVHCDFQLEELKKALSQFVGTIYQKPPVRSSVKRRVRKGGFTVWSSSRPRAGWSCSGSPRSRALT